MVRQIARDRAEGEGMASGNDHNRVSTNAGLSLGNAYNHSNIAAATSPSQAEINRVAKGFGIGAGSAVDFSGATAVSATERVNEDTRAGKGAGIGCGSTINPA
jgi:hypothetical protein